MKFAGVHRKMSKSDLIPKDFYSVSEASIATGMTSPRIMRRIRSNTIIAQKIGWVWVIPAAEIEKLKEEMKNNPGE